jgi:hypothetical protein
MYPKKFTFDPETIARARLVTMRAPNLNILREGSKDEMPGIAHFMENAIKIRNQAGKLLLPDLSALANTSVGIFSDYGGEDAGSNYATYSFLVCAFGSLGPFNERMAKLRSSARLGTKEIAYKDLRMGKLRKFLPNYLRLADGFISGILFTMAVEKTIPSLFGPPEIETYNAMVDTLEKGGFGTLKPKVAEKLLRIVHAASFLLALLGHKGQKIFWMTDHDAISATSEQHKRLLGVLNAVLPLYTTKAFSFLGGARPFEPRSCQYLDLLSIPDIAAGAIAQCLTSIDVRGKEKAEIKEGAEHALRWLCHDSITLKKFCMVVKQKDGQVVSGPVDFEARLPIPDELFVPMHLVL